MLLQAVTWTGVGTTQHGKMWLAGCKTSLRACHSMCPAGPHSLVSECNLSCQPAAPAAALLLPPMLQKMRRALSRVAAATSASLLPSAAAMICSVKRSAAGRLTWCSPAACSCCGRAASEGRASSQAGDRSSAPSGLSLSSSRRSSGTARTCGWDKDSTAGGKVGRRPRWVP